MRLLLCSQLFRISTSSHPHLDRSAFIARASCFVIFNPFIFDLKLAITVVRCVCDLYCAINEPELNYDDTYTESFRREDAEQTNKTVVCRIGDKQRREEAI